MIEKKPQTLIVEFAHQVATVTLNRPEVRNAFNEAMIVELTTVFRELSERDDVRAVVLGANGKAFCAGADLNWMKQMAGYSDDDNHADALRLADMLRSIYRCGKPVIARVNGDVYAGGMGLICACDIVISVDTAHFCLSEARLGLIPATIAPYVIRALGERASRRYFATAEQFDCATALRLGFVSEAVTEDKLDDAVQQLAAILCSNGPRAVRACKQLVQDIAGREIDTALIEDTAVRIAQVRASAEGREGIASFLEKRAPAWRN
ncbi:enoyl-CoA hydratase/isomerase family protein [Paraburkholderia rhizosphaerae]|uniref:Methylglutaconyl-CoA hydratase n=1 Tax=Paraburkholderia rhizosphaerae TaxID=480658 RepID=A0A4R8M0S9_9BURK|nr:enoyl-CoA hydratase/isomerase family protein [Paraburkholderia rhizosphaerae]TDY54146.1 methylglutaconyl-CoA hydratase [Paraburkholderia rhizosphaerae]